MCEKQKRIEELEIENASLYKTISEIYKNKSEENLNNVKSKYHPFQVIGALVTPLIVAFLVGGATVYAAIIATLKL